MTLNGAITNKVFWTITGTLQEVTSGVEGRYNKIK